jgi:uncharacterized protein YutE (UPF0331/DUF86 family)
MSPGQIDSRVVVARLERNQTMLAAIATLPLATLEEFVADPRMVGAGESFLRRSLEALLDLGRHVLAKAFGHAVSEYADIGDRLGTRGVLSPEDAGLVRKMAGYRNRLVHLCDEIDDAELFRMLTVHIGEARQVAEALRTWITEYPTPATDSVSH